MARPIDVLARRATQCSFSSAFHQDAGTSPAVRAGTNSVYTWLIAPVVVLCAAVGLWRYDDRRVEAVRERLAR